ncbi:splicing factor, suppressor of white-apricot homolog isoform X1 [Erpetoichthys calabaricus]|uniref:Splicing factor, suppressor of white-apricot homolog n=1 Tax=Erpetoichthys calabaricus TaxID=27687 RepID=A0A8C4TAC2_ERPCA|nr:splicing factor, suppressor of white-apricot homolog isoform X1 [Erpetoichthys calabaricus]
MYRRGVSKKDSKAVPNPEESGSGGKYAELLVFGYACKLFRDDERAAYHEQGRHLIPWMGDKNIMIDRYDGRGHLHDLSEYDADSWNRDYKLSEEEARIEALCDEERYLALHTDLLEEEARQEEEYKRLSEALADEGSYNAVGFQYSADYYDPSQPTEEEETSKETVADQEDSEEPFIAPAGLCVPPDVELPATTKMHAIIERTASFVCKQGTQFEIMLKAKQARNSQFDFLRFDHYLNPYYKHILKAMKEGKYVTAGEAKAEEKTKCEDDDSDDDDDDGNGDYLHPSLFASKKCDRLEELMKPLKVMDPDHPLAALVRKAQLENNMAAAKMSEEPLTVASKENEYSLDSTVATVYYGYYILPDGTYCLAPPPPGIDVNTYYSSLPAGVLSAASGSAATSAVHSATPPMSPGQASTQTTAATTSSQTSVAAIIPPPPDIQPVIDKLAEYVARNGAKFESSVRAKNDSRFDFLQSWHQYNAYYEFKKQYFIQKEGLDKPKVLAASESGNVADTPVLPQATNSPSVSNAENLITESTNSPDKAANEGKLIKASFAPISFAIKAKENDLLPLEKNRVKLDDDSDEEDKEGQENTSSVTAKESQPPVVEEKKPQLTQEELEAKQAKQKLEDRLAAAAREKLAQASKESKEKQLQAERKRKAALFLQNLKSPFLEVDTRKLEESSTLMEEALVEISHHGGMKQLSSAPCPEINIVPAAPTVVSKVVPVMESKITERDMDRNKVHSHVHEKEKKKKKHKKRSRSRSPSHSRYRSRSRSRSKAKHSLPSAYRTVRKSRSRSRSTSRRQPHSSERKREEREKDRCVPSAYRISNSPAFSKKRSRSRSPHERKKKRSSKSQIKSKVQSRSPSSSPKHTSNNKPSSAHSTSISPAESRGSSLERSSRGDSQEKEKEVSSAIVSSVQSKITQDLMAKVRAMLAASKDLQTSTS